MPAQNGGQGAASRNPHFQGFREAALASIEAQRGTAGLSAEQAKDRAIENLRRQLPSPSELVRPLAGQQIGAIDIGHYYTASLIVAHEAWAEVAQRFDGKLLVAVPAPEVLLYASGSDASSVAALSAIAQDLYSRAPRGVSPTVLAWTPSGWVEASAPR